MLFADQHFTLSDAQSIVPHLSRTAGRCREEMEHVWTSLRGEPSDRFLLASYRRLDQLKVWWFREVRLLGAIPRRLWEVSFDTGDGFCYSWRLGEEAITHIHGREVGHLFVRRPLRFR